ncbi:hypothetical protein [Teredinibacter sp. KSP-S5-2]|uniref:hypothetical protein n=1 Tax=Teredinibacter sp. KSP-S5-2 TaxID=3034506 RepID=UPI002934BE1B|nr:hypothetical protein [Teredinibacter sp. KSP-S5-2]WNO10488.1 hypothetical protein P5V12_04815 [Teredinibacter sp. KSP-S5-2]
MEYILINNSNLTEGMIYYYTGLCGGGETPQDMLYESGLTNIGDSDSRQRLLFVPDNEVYIYCVNDKIVPTIVVSTGYRKWIYLMAVNVSVGAMVAGCKSLKAEFIQDLMSQISLDPLYITYYVESGIEFTSVLEVLEGDVLNLAKVIDSLLFKFSIFHEIAHIKLGHIDSIDMCHEQELEADRCALKLISSLPYPRNIARHILPFYFLYQEILLEISDKNRESHPTSKTRSSNMIDSNILGRGFDQDGVIFSDLMDKSEEYVYNNILKYEGLLLESSEIDIQLNRMAYNYWKTQYLYGCEKRSPFFSELLKIYGKLETLRLDLAGVDWDAITL